MSDRVNEDDEPRHAGAHAAEPDDAQDRGAGWSAEASGPPPGPGEPYPAPPQMEQSGYSEHPVYSEQSPFVDHSPQFAEPPHYADRPQFVEQPRFLQQAPYSAPEHYVRQPPQFVEQAPSYGEQPPYGREQQFEPQPQYEPQQQFEPQPQYGEHPMPSKVQPDAAAPAVPPLEHAGPRPSPVPSQPRYGPSGYGAPGPAPIPRPEDLLVPITTNLAAQPASWGWRGKLNRGSGGMIKAKAAPDELLARRAIVGIQRSFSRPMTVVVIQPKGGAGKTPTTICLSAAFGAHRGGYVVGWDDNETRGTLAVRVANPDNQRATVWDLLSDLPAFERFDARVGDLSYYVRAQPDAHFDALVSDDNPGNMAQIGEDEFQRLHRVLQRFYRMIVVDTGNNVRSANWQAAVNSADLVVVVSTYQRDVGFSGSWVLDHLAQTGREDLARNAVSILTAAEPVADKAVRDQLMSHFSARTRAVVQIPYDKELAHGGPITWTSLTPQTRNAWVRAGATIADALAEQDERTLAERRS
ncbi:MAG: hypothetical protein ACR2LX_11210 [Jatrophihabitans sp.]